MKPLRPKQQAFVTEFLVDHNATQACIRAGYSRCGANSKGAQLLANVSIGSAIQQAMDQARTDAVMDVTESLTILTKIARAYVPQVLDEGGRIDPAKVTACRQELAEFSEEITDDGFRRKVKFRDPIAAIDSLARKLGWDKAQKVESDVRIVDNRLTLGDIRPRLPSGAGTP